MGKCARCGLELTESSLLFVGPVGQGYQPTHSMDTCIQLLSKALVDAYDRISQLETTVDDLAE